MLKDNIGPSETPVYVPDQEFDTGISNTFAMVAFEDDVLKDAGHFTGEAVGFVQIPSQGELL